MKSLLKKAEVVEEEVEETEEEVVVVEAVQGGSVDEIMKNATGKAKEVLDKAYAVKGEATSALYLKRKVEKMQSESGEDYTSIIDSIEKAM
tara:strand:- start:258 stop:530 length:273 start_codon:yes stop_codon:yes gene_type:complete